MLAHRFGMASRVWPSGAIVRRQNGRTLSANSRSSRRSRAMTTHPSIWPWFMKVSTRIWNDLRGCLAAGFPFVFGFTVYASFESDYVARTGHVPMPHWFERAIGGHAVMAVGYDDASSTFIVRNSWGPGWGDGGYFLFSLRVHDKCAFERFLDNSYRRIGDTSMSAIVRYWPAVVAGLYLLYVIAAGKADQVTPALAAFLAALVSIRSRRRHTRRSTPSSKCNMPPLSRRGCLSGRSPDRRLGDSWRGAGRHDVRRFLLKMPPSGLEPETR